jgi:hypothetical protein
MGKRAAEVVAQAHELGVSAQNRHGRSGPQVDFDLVH